MSIHIQPKVTRRWDQTYSINTDDTLRGTNPLECVFLEVLDTGHVKEGQA